MAIGAQAVARKQYPEEESIEAPRQDVEAALSSVREVEVEPVDTGDAREAEGAIERAIQTLDREARGEATSAPEAPASGAAGHIDAEYAPAPKADITPLKREPDTGPQLDEPVLEEDAESGRGGGGLTIFLMVFVLLLAGVGGAGYWAWREGYVDLDQMFGRVATEAPAADAAPAIDADVPTLDSAIAEAPVDEEPGQTESGPGNTATEAVTPEPTTALEGLEPEPEEARLAPADEAGEPLTDATESSGDPVTLDDERLPSAEDAASLSGAAASVDPEDLAGSQSLLLEAALDGRTGAVPFSGTVEWSRGTDELGMPTIEATASIPARNMDVEVILRRNTDPSLPASHLMEVSFDVSDTFIGGSITSLPGVLLKNEELVQGTPLEGASARVVGNSFLFALSESEEDISTNRDLLATRKWMDLAVIYATGQRAIITLEKDDAAEELFDDVLASWEAEADGTSEG